MNIMKAIVSYLILMSVSFCALADGGQLTHQDTQGCLAVEQGQVILDMVCKKTDKSTHWVDFYNNGWMSVSTDKCLSANSSTEKPVLIACDRYSKHLLKSIGDNDVVQLGLNNQCIEAFMSTKGSAMFLMDCAEDDTQYFKYIW